MSTRRYPPDLLARTAAASGSLVDLARRLGTPLGSGSLRYLRKRLDHYSIDTAHFTAEPLPARPRRTYGRAELEEAAAAGTSVRDVLDHLKVPPYDSAYTHIRRRLEALNIDTSHFTGGWSGAKRLPARERLAAAVTASRSVAEALRRLDLPDNGANRLLFRRGLDLYGLSTAHFTGRGHERGVPSPRRKPAEAILRRLPPGSPRTKTTLLRRALDERRVPRRCAECGLGDVWQGRRLVLEIDHVNGDPLDNRIGNLRYLCPSCHSQTETFARRRSLPGGHVASTADAVE
ncbi:HNH endonuclease [Streptomyces zingiberis]|uniref:HNH endonuclease n=1 Tax=Streptomyces zingiberis TaxID=2053010 RepID=UPI0028933AC6|nr:HNH endonuclease signature motif containing protein [Streptomyces zingiberis]